MFERRSTCQLWSAAKLFPEGIPQICRGHHLYEEKLPAKNTLTKNLSIYEWNECINRLQQYKSLLLIIESPQTRED